MRKSFVSLLAGMLLATLSACQLLNVSGPPGNEKPEGMNDYDHAVEQFELTLNEVQRIQEVLYGERWLFNDYGNRPETCNKGAGGRFTVLRMTPRQDQLEGNVPRTVEEAHRMLSTDGFSVGEIRQKSDGSDQHFRINGETGYWKIDQNDYGAWSIYGASACLDINQKKVWEEMNQNGFSYNKDTEWALFPHERLPIRRGETPAPSPTPYPASPTYGRPRPTSTQYLPPTTSPAGTPSSSRPEQTP